MIRNIITSIILLASTESSAFQIMKMNSMDQESTRFHAKYSTEELSKFDTDGDGKLNWKFDPLFPGTLFPNDEDIDGDGVDNFFDKEPYNKNNSDYVVSDIYKNGAASEDEIIFMDSLNIKFIDYTDTTHLDTVKMLSRILSEGISQNLLKCFSKLKYVLAYKNMANPYAKGYYLSPLEAIALPGAKLITGKIFKKSDEMVQTIAHELGHVVAYSCENPKSLGKIAVRMGLWAQPDEEIYSFGQKYFQNAKGGGVLNESFLSSYAQANIHEWYAENFAGFIMWKLGKKSLVSKEFKEYFSSL